MHILFYLFVYLILVKLFAILLRFLCRFDWFYDVINFSGFSGKDDIRQRYKYVNDDIVFASLLWPFNILMLFVYGLFELIKLFLIFLYKILEKII